MDVLCTLLQDRLWAGIQVSMSSSANQNKQIALQKHNWYADSFLAANNNVNWLCLMNFQQPNSQHFFAVIKAYLNSHFFNL
jgi:hypothetical protein